jgi:hypothetical protein
VSGRSMSNQRDPLAITIGTVGLLAQVGMWVWWGGKIDQRVETLEKSQQQSDVQALDKVNVDALQTMQIKVVETKIDNIKESVDRIDRKIPERTR